MLPSISVFPGKYHDRDSPDAFQMKVSWNLFCSSSRSIRTGIKRSCTVAGFRSCAFVLEKASIQVRIRLGVVLEICACLPRQTHNRKAMCFPFVRFLSLWFFLSTGQIKSSPNGRLALGNRLSCSHQAGFWVARHSCIRSPICFRCTSHVDAYSMSRSIHVRIWDFVLSASGNIAPPSVGSFISSRSSGIR